MYLNTSIKGILGITTVMLIGCGGGGNSDPESTPSGSGSSNITNVSLSGTAAKGIINKGNVVASELDAKGTAIAQVGTAITGANGTYTLTLGSNYKGGPIEVTISADANTQMKCDVPAGCGTRTDDIVDTDTIIDFGEWYKPGSLTMKALVAEAATNDTIGVNITPYTNLAADRALAAASLTAAEVYSANSEVSNLLGGIDILNTQPLDITDATAVGSGSATEIAYAAFSAAIAALADTSGGTPDIDGALTTLSNSFSDGTIPADDGGTDDNIISLQEIIDGASGTLTQTGTADTSGTLAALQRDVDGAAAGGNVDPAPSDTTGSTALAKVKAFVSDVRTWGTVIDAEVSAKGEAFGQQADLASAAADVSMKFLVGPAFGAALEVTLMNFTATTDTDLNAYRVGTMGSPQFTAGTITRAGDAITITDGVFNGNTINMSVKMPIDGTTASNFTIGITSATFRSANVDTDINSGTLTVNLASSYIFDLATMEAGTAANPDISGGSIDLDISLTQKQDASNTALASAVTFAGAMKATLAKPITDAASGDITWITPSTLTLSGNISSAAGHSLDASLTVNITNAASFTPATLPMGTIKTGMVSWAYTDISPADGVNDTFILTSPERTLGVQWDSSSRKATISETWSYSFGVGYASGYVDFGPYANVVSAVSVISSRHPLGGYQWVDGEGQYSVDLSAADFSTNGTGNGTLVDPEFALEGSGAGQWLKGTAGLDFALQLDGLPKATINISGNRTGFESGTAKITIAYGTRKIVIDGDLSSASSTPGSISITNQDGVTMVIDGDFDSETGDIKYNGQTYGSVKKLSNGMIKITYNDGTFESF